MITVLYIGGKTVASNRDIKLSTPTGRIRFTLGSGMKLNPPYLLFLGNAASQLEIKTATGLAHWRPDRCLGQWRLPRCKASAGLPDLDPAAAVAGGARSVVIGAAPAGGTLNPEWIPALTTALEAGLDIVSGLHVPLSSIGELADTAAMFDRRLVDVRIPPANIPVATGKPRSGRRLLTVGTDCCVGKKFTALAIHRAMTDAGLDAAFRATGQTGILIAGEGIPLDAVVSDFLPGAVELLSPAAGADHWDVIEGQGSLFHPAYAAVTLGLIHGSQPEALVLCHAAGRTEIDDHPGYPIPPLPQCIERYIEAAALTSPKVKVTGISINTSTLPEDQRRPFLEELSRRSRLPCVDPVLTGVGPLLDALHLP